MIRIDNSIFQLHTKHTSYIFRVTETGHLEHLYYGKYLGELREDDVRALEEKVPFQMGNLIAYDQEHLQVTLENMCLEMSSYGKGDAREPFVEIVHADGGQTCDFLFDHAEIRKEKEPFQTLPGSYGLPEGEYLCVILKDEGYGLCLELHYYVYEREDVICRSSRLINASKESIQLKRLMSCQLDLPDAGYVCTSFTGAWANEMTRKDTLLQAGTFSLSSMTGTSSNRANPFFMIHRPQTEEETGECYGFNLIYSGNHYEAVQVNAFGKTRIVNGINPTGFLFHLAPGEDFEAPEAVMTYSEYGFGRLSRNMSRFVHRHIVRGDWKNKKRPILINSWEASYYRFDEDSLLKLARAAKEVGIELFVLDDGWFGQRNDDTSSLGDWTENKKKLPEGLPGLSKKIREVGLEFGIWVEPEMVNTDSDLYRLHPDWTMEIPGKKHAEGRNQRLLDLANPEVVSYLTKTMSRIFSSANISYVKWDMNRIFSDVYSPYLPAERQGETAHRYVLGLYQLLHNLTERFPSILFEGCSSGGGRFDLGMLCYFPQIWGSDNTDPVCRVKIQEGYSYGYPLNCVSAHVSASPNHQTLRETPISSRFAVAAFGILGYELNLLDLKKEELAEIKEEIRIYKKWRGVLQDGNFYRVCTGRVHNWICVSKDQTKAVGLLFQELSIPNEQYLVFQAAGLKEKAYYHFYNIAGSYDIREFGSLVNAASPIHIKQDSLLEKTAAKLLKLPGEKEDYKVSGAVLMHSGIRLKGAFTGNGYNQEVRLFKDFASRMYFMEECSQGDPVLERGNPIPERED